MTPEPRKPAGSGRRAQAKAYPRDEAPHQARLLFRRAYQMPLRTHIAKLVAGYGALTGDQLHRLCARRFAVTAHFIHFERTLARLCQADVLGVIPDLEAALRDNGVRPRARPSPRRASDTRLRAYALGPVGEHLAALLLGRAPGPANASPAHLHDALCAEAMLRLCEQDPELEPVPAGAVAVWDAEGGRFVYRPDGLLVRRVDGQVAGGLLVELCNEPWTSPERAAKKLAKFADLARAQHWLAWGLPWMPELLIIYRALSTVETFRQLAPRLVAPGCGLKALSLASALRDDGAELLPLAGA